MRLDNPITGIPAPVSGATTPISIPVGPRYHALNFFCYVDGVLTDADDVVERVILKVNEKTEWDVTVATLLAYHALNNLPVTAGTLPIPFSDPSRADKDDEQWSAWDTYGEASFTVDLVIKSGITDPIKIEGQRIYDYGFTNAGTPEAPIRAKNIVRLRETNVPTAQGPTSIDNLPRSAPILRLLMSSAANISHVEVKADDATVFDSGKTYNDEKLLHYGLDGSAFKFALCFDYTERLQDFLIVNRTLNVKPTASAAGSTNILMVTLASGFGAA